VVVVEATRLKISDPARLYDALYSGIRFPRLDYPVTVRPLYSVANLAIDAGDSWLPAAIDFTAITILADTLTELWQAALSWEQHNPAAPIPRRDVIVMKSVAAHASGQAVSRLDMVTDSVQYHEGIAASTLRLPHLGPWKRPDRDLPPFGQRLQQLLRGVHRTVGRGDWQIKWADDGQICWLLEIRPTRA
jgi:hypothetical protein